MGLRSTPVAARITRHSGRTIAMNLDSGRIALAVITAFVAALLAITLSLGRNGRIDAGYVVLMAVIGLVASLIWSHFAARRRP
jgi:hypothetical protein